MRRSQSVNRNSLWLRAELGDANRDRPVVRATAEDVEDLQLHLTLLAWQGTTFSRIAQWLALCSGLACVIYLGAPDWRSPLLHILAVALCVASIAALFAAESASRKHRRVSQQLRRVYGLPTA